MTVNGHASAIKITVCWWPTGCIHQHLVWQGPICGNL